jgi:MFS superfamily sulfate permease-like transporter
LITGPAAGLSVLVFDLVRQFGWERLGLIVLMAGLIQAAAGILKLGQWFRAVSPAVIHGMLAGIGILIFASQFHIMLDDVPRSTALENIASLPDAVYRGVVPVGDANHHHAARIGLLTIVLIVLWKSVGPKRLKTLPPPLLAVVVATAVTALFGLPINTITLPENLATAITLPDFAGVTPDLWRPILIAAISIAFIASAETLLSATAVDQMHTGPRTQYDRELAAQGVGNVVSGALGALPMTGVIVRSAANVEAGARSNKSEILHGVWLLLFVCVFPSVLSWIPTASLAAILVYTGYKLVDVKAVRTLKKFGRGEVAVWAGTVIMIVATDLLTGVVVGIGLSVLKLMIAFSHLEVRIEDDPVSNRTFLFLEGSATFLRLPKLAAALDAVPHTRELHVHFDHLEYIDHACLDLLMTWRKQREAVGGGTLVIDWANLSSRFHEHGKSGTRRNGKPTSDSAAREPNVPAAGHPSALARESHNAL